MSEINLFLLPFAGGSKYSYTAFTRHSPDFINAIAIDLPGRGSRYNENLLKDANSLAGDIYEQIRGQLDKPYALYGHSMGTLLGYLVARKLEENDQRLPIHLFFTGCIAPSAMVKEKKRHLLPKQEFLEELRMLDGSPSEILDNMELMDFFEPVIRADFEAIETYIYRDRHPMNIPITILNGDKEIRAQEDVECWQKESLHKIDIRQMSGRHFFIFNCEQEIWKVIAEKLS